MKPRLPDERWAGVVGKSEIRNPKRFLGNSVAVATLLGINAKAPRRKGARGDVTESGVCDFSPEPRFGGRSSTTPTSTVQNGTARRSTAGKILLRAFAVLSPSFVAFGEASREGQQTAEMRRTPSGSDRSASLRSSRLCGLPGSTLWLRLRRAMPSRRGVKSELNSPGYGIAGAPFRISDFAFRISFGFRFSGFGFPPLP